MTDVVTGPSAADGTAPITPADSGAGAPPSDAVFAWSPPEPPAPRRRRLWLWIGIPAGVVVLGAAAASLFLIAPGTAVGGVQVGGLTSAGAADAIANRLATTTVTVSSPDGDVVVSGADLGATTDAAALADAAFAERPAWNPTAWFGAPIDATVTLDAEKAAAALEAVLPDFYTDATDATLAFHDGAYVTEAGTSGEGIDLETVTAALSRGFAKGASDIRVTAASVEVPASITTHDAQTTADRLNAMVASAGFYVGDERTIPIDAATLHSWLTIDEHEDGGFEITADERAIQQAVDGLAAQVDRAPVDATVITDPSGRVLSEETVGLNGRQLGDTDGIADAFAAQLASGDAVYELPVSETPFATTALARNIDVNLSEQRAYLWENGTMVWSRSISSGVTAAGNGTPTGDFTVFAHVRVQDMGLNCDGDGPPGSYCTRDVPYVTYFAPDVGFHGASNFRSYIGGEQSHGCLNMWDDDAKFIYDWAPTGTPVSVHY